MRTHANISIYIHIDAYTYIIQLIQTHTCTYIQMCVCVCIVCIYCIVWIVLCCMYCMNMIVLHVYVCISCIVCIVCIRMYLHVLHVLNVLYVWVCIVCMRLYIFKYFYRYIHIHAHTYIHTIQTKYRNDVNVCMCMYFWLNTYIIHTACFTYIHIQTCRFPDEVAYPCVFKWNVHLRYTLISIQYIHVLTTYISK